MKAQARPRARSATRSRRAEDDEDAMALLPVVGRRGCVPGAGQSVGVRVGTSENKCAYPSTRVARLCSVADDEKDREAT